MAKTIYWYEHGSRKKTRKHDFEKDFFKLRKNSVFGKIKENVRTNIDIKLITAERRRIYLVSGSNFHRTNFSKYVSKDTYEWKRLFRTSNTTVKESINAWLLLLKWKTKI